MFNKRDPNFLIPLTSDTMFKLIMKKHKDYTINLISLITGIPKDDLKDAEFNDPNIMDDNINHKHQVADIIISIDKETINLEMNNYKSGVLTKNTSYLFNIYNNNIKYGEDYDEAKVALQINFNNFDLPSDDGIVNRYAILNEANGKPLTKMFRIYNINLAKLANNEYTESVDKELLTLLKVMEVKTANELETTSKGNTILESVCKSMIEYSKDDAIVGLYDKEEQERRFINTARNEGIKQGKQAGKIEDAINMLKANIDINLISKVTGLSINEIKKLEP
jgi:predicted transposase/invertase (TIGR01784 family)